MPTTFDDDVFPAASVAVARTSTCVCGITRVMLPDQSAPPPDIEPEPDVEPDHERVTDPIPPTSDTDAV